MEFQSPTMSKFCLFSLPRFKEIESSKIIEQLICRNDYQSAISISEFINSPSSHIFEDWGRNLVLNVEDDEKIYQKLIETIPKELSLDYTTIAKEAFFVGKRILALKILEIDLSLENQNSLLIHMKEYRKALTLSIERKDSNGSIQTYFNISSLQHDQIFRKCFGK
jgi:hypothetical protein